ncbi:hypothetical protein P691DRAFT_785478 [Macrolepiota fuliginosa MF-IS2]|uniref:Uncharacterized protein n=1 Tax=Macrolepiota fuliginosa MF-IS2 TaxID=1400762 RepID=A0A9P6C164_9AGAR|nr:hypothetical protein P691DRAFT_785478 [Macrolepiota fuliginosa MF-IS2]
MVSSHISFFSILLAVLTTSLQAHATNDWSKPCFNGTCQYDLPTSANGTGASGTIKIWGANSSISDMTTAAGWEILGCDPDAMEQDVRAVSGNGTVSASPAAASGVPSGEQGAVGKIVRLPEGVVRVLNGNRTQCGKNPFAVIAKAWIPEDQSIPQGVRRRLVTRDGEVPMVKAVKLSVDFGTYGNTSNAQPVNFSIVGANVPGAAASGDSGTLVPTSSSGISVRRSRIHHSSRGFGEVNFNKSTALGPINFNKDVNLINAQLPCAQGAGADVTLAAKIDVEAGVNVTFGVVASGTLVPPNVHSFGIESSITADLDGAIIMSAGVGGTLDSGSISIPAVEFPGLDFHGVLSVGPTFQVNARATASLNLDVDMRVGVNYHIGNAQFVFPGGEKNDGAFTPSDTPLTLSAQPSAQATGTVEAHLIPSLNFGISVFGGTVKAGVFLELDASATVTLTVEATGAEESNTISPREVGPVLNITRTSGMMVPRGRGMIGEYYFDRRSTRPASTLTPTVKSSKSESPPKPTATKSAGILEPRMSKATTSTATKLSSGGGSFEGCLEVNTGLSVNVGADASFFGLFSPSTTLSLFTQDFELFKQCFGDQASQRRGLVRERSPVMMLEGRAQNLKCNSGGQNPVKVVETTVPKAQISVAKA